MKNHIKPWEDEVWNQGRISAKNSYTTWSFIATAVVWNSFAIPFFYLLMSRHYHGDWNPVLLLGFFPIVGVVFAYFAIVQIVRWRRLKYLELQMNPFPGSLGGDVGGKIDIPITYLANHQYDLTLQCVQVPLNSKHTEKIIWQEQERVIAETNSYTSCLNFRFALPENLPQTGNLDLSYHQWRLLLKVDSASLNIDCCFVVPVYRTPETLNTTGVARYTPAQINKTAIPGTVAELSQLKNARRLYYPSTRNLKNGISLLLYSVLLISLLNLAYSGIKPDITTWLKNPVGDYVSACMIISAIGFIISGVYVLSNSLEIFFTFDKIITIRRVLGIPIERSVNTGDICQLISSSEPGAGKDKNKSPLYSLKAKTNDGKQITLGDGIPGTVVAKKLQQFIRETLNTSLDWIEANRTGPR